MKNIFREFFTFNKRERNGVFILISIIFVLVLYLNISSRFVSQEPVDFAKFDNDVAEFRASVKEKEATAPFSENTFIRKGRTEKSRSERFIFDPNDLPELDWKRLGLSEKQIRSIKNFESKGGRFRRKEDVKKMYVIQPELYLSLEPYIQLKPSNEIKIEAEGTPVFQDGKVENAVPVLNPKNSIVNVELNSADSIQLTRIKGIGPFYAKNIIKYRNSIGGFVTKEQLLEVWKFDREKLNSIEKFINVDASKIKKININSCEADQLKSPYINWNVANAIVNYRKSHGKYRTVEEIKKTDLVDDETYRKIAPYLVIE